MKFVLALFGALLMAGGVAARIEAGSHRPTYNTTTTIELLGQGGPASAPAPARQGWSPTAYDLVRIGGWALLIFGAVIVAFALVREFRRPA